MNEPKIKAAQPEQIDALIIQRTAVGGTVLLNTTKGDGAADALRAAGFRWRWSRNIGYPGRGMCRIRATGRPVLG